MQPSENVISIVVAEDDPDDRLLIQEAFEEARFANNMDFVEDGVELLEYLRSPTLPQPGLLLIDLNMPRKDGREVIKEIKADPLLQQIPIVILTTSEAESDICRSYKLGANSYIQKPVSFEGLVEVVKVLNRYWLQIVSLPTGPRRPVK